MPRAKLNVQNEDGLCVASCGTRSSNQENLLEEQQSNAQLIAEAGTVANATGLTPRQLLEQRDSLLEALEIVKKQSGIIWDSKPGQDFHVGGMMHIITQAIEKTKK